VALVPKNCDGRPMTPPELKSTSARSSMGASNGVKKSAACRVPSACTSSRTTDWPKSAGGWLLGMIVSGLPPLMELPVEKKSDPSRSDMRPPPAIQSPPPAVAVPLRVVHMALICPLVETPTTQP
jgi:hypothetical protein